MKRLRLSQEDSTCSEDMDIDEGAVAAGPTLVSQVFSNHLITDKIFSQVFYDDLLSCSLVSKSWNFEARRTLVTEHESSLRITETTSTEDLQEFDRLISSALLRGHQLPFNGIEIKLDAQDVLEWPFANFPFPQLLRSISGKLRVKTLDVDLGGLSLPPEVIRFIIRTFIAPHFRTLERILIEDLKLKKDFPLDLHRLHLAPFPKLKTLGLDVKIKDSTFVRILRACPMLKELLYPVPPSQLHCLRQANKLHVCFRVDFDILDLTPEEAQIIGVFGEAVKNLGIDLHREEDLRLSETGSLAAKLQPMFFLFQNHLENLIIDLKTLFVLFMSRRLPPLGKLKHLMVYGSLRCVAAVFKSMNFAPLFPNLASMTVRSSEDDDSDWFRRELTQVPPDIHFDKTQKTCLPSLSKLSFAPWDIAPWHELVIKTVMLESFFPCVTELNLVGVEIWEYEDTLQWIVECWGDLLQVLRVGTIQCFSLETDDNDVRDFLLKRRHFRNVMRRPLPSGVKHSDKFRRLRQVQMEFVHERVVEREERSKYGHAQKSFRPRQDQKCELTVSGCGAKKRLERVKIGVSLFDTLLGLFPCPEVSLFEQIIMSQSVCARLCKMLPNKDLLNCSVVSKRWNRTAREVLNKDRVCVLTVEPFRPNLEDTKAKFRWLMKSKQSFFNVLRICKSTPAVVDFQAFYEIISSFLDYPVWGQSIQHLEIRGGLESDLTAAGVSGVSEEHSEAKLFRFIAKFLGGSFLSRVRHLDTCIYNFDGVFRNDEGQLLVPNLRSINILDHWKLQEYSESFERILRELNDLEEIRSPLSGKLLPLVASVNKAHCVKYVQVYEQHQPPAELDPLKERSDRELRNELECLLTFAEVYQPALKSVTIPSGSFSRGTKPMLAKVLPLLCTRSSESLQHLSVDLVVLSLVASKYTKPMVAVRSTNLTYERGCFDCYRLVQNLPFGEMFPTIEEVTFTPQSSSLGQHHDEDHHLLRISRLNPGPCSTVKSITFRGNHELISDEYMNIEHEILEYIGNAFPRVEKFCYYYGPPSKLNWEDFKVLFSAVWTSFPSLKTVLIHSPITDPESLGVSVFGITAEEFQRWNELIPNGFLGNKFNAFHYAPTTDSAAAHCKHFKGFKILPATGKLNDLESCIEFGIEEADG